MPAIDDNDHAENGARAPAEIRLMALETRLTAVQVDLAVIKVSYATKDDIQRVLALLHEHRLEFHDALARQREDFHAALAKHREELNAALARQRDDFNAALAKQRDDFNTALAKQRDDFNAMQLRLQKTMMGHMWKLYGFASLMLGGVYFIARYVH